MDQEAYRITQAPRGYKRILIIACDISLSGE